MNANYKETLEALRRGGVAVYPTETLYALGCSAYDRAACCRVAELKGRSPHKPLPLVLGRVEDLGLASASASEEVMRLAGAFWPGPLSVLVRGVEALARETMDGRGLVSVRVTPHPLAAALSMDLEAPLVATSANRSGAAPTARPDELDRELLARVDAVLTDEPLPPGGPPSTLVECLGQGRIRVLRPGAVLVSALQEAGFIVAD